MSNGAQVDLADQNWWEYWRPFLIPFTLVVFRVLTKKKLAEYPWPVLSSDLCFFGATFYIWALTIRLSEIKVCPPSRRLAKNDGEAAYIVIFLIVNFGLSFLLYPASRDICEPLSVVSMIVALVVAIGSPLYLRWRV